MLNIYAYECEKDKVTIKNYEHSQILTLDDVDFDAIGKDSSGFLVNSHGNRYLVIHQIDRCGPENLEYLKVIILPVEEP